MVKSQIPKVSIEQWAAFKAVVDEGSHAAAAEVLNKSQSTVSYLIARLNEQLPMPALVVQGRKAQLTELGQVLYRHASNLLAQAQACEDTAAYLASGWESELCLACDGLTPMTPVMCALHAFSQQSPLTRVKILETSLSGTDEAILQRACDLAITPRVPLGFLADPLTTVTMVAVAHVSHPLSLQGSVSEAELKQHRQIVLRDTGTKREQNAGWLNAEQRWTVSHFATSVDMVLQGLGFAFLPFHRVQTLVSQHQLKTLPLEIGAQRSIPISAVYTSNVPGPGTNALMAAIQTSFSKI